MLRRRYYSKYMDHEEIESILHMQVGMEVSAVEGCW